MSPGLGGVLQIHKPALLDAGLLDSPLGRLQGRLEETLQYGVPGGADDVPDVVSVAPVQHPVATEAGITAEDDADLGPASPERLDQQRQDGPRVLGIADVAGPQVGHQQLVSAEDV